MQNKTFDELMQQADMLFDDGKYEKAIAYYKDAQELDRMREETYVSIGMCYGNLGKFDLAKEELEKALKINRKSGIANYQLGNVEMATGDKNKALNYYYSAVANGYEDDQLYYMMAMICAENNDKMSALRYFNQSLLLDENRFDARLNKIGLLIDMRRNEEALANIDSLLEMRFDSFEGHHLKCRLLIDMGRYEEALESITASLERFPKDTALAIDKGIVYARKGMKNEAFSVFDEIEKNFVLTNDDLRTICVERAQLYLDSSDVDAGINCLCKAKEAFLADNPEGTDDEAVFSLMNCYMAKEKFQDSLACADELLHKGDNTDYKLSARFYKALSLDKIGKKNEAKKEYDEAENFYRDYLKENPGDISAYALRIMCLSENGNSEMAMELANFVCDLYEEIPEAHNIKETLLEKMGKTEEAEKERIIISKLQGEK